MWFITIKGLLSWLIVLSISLYSGSYSSNLLLIISIVHAPYPQNIAHLEIQALVFLIHHLLLLGKGFSMSYPLVKNIKVHYHNSSVNVYIVILTGKINRHPKISFHFLIFCTSFFRWNALYFFCASSGISYIHFRLWSLLHK